MLSLLCCRRMSLVSPYVRNIGESSGGSRVLLCGFLVSGYRRLTSVEAVEGRNELKLKGGKASFVVSYLMKSCGMSLESAKSASRYIRFSSPKKPDSVLELLKKHGFSRHQIAKVVRSYPAILLVNIDNLLLPKLEFLDSIGLSVAERTKLITSCPRILAASLHNTLIPSYNSLKSILTGNEVVGCLKRATRLLIVDVQKHLALKVSVLSDHGVPQGHVKSLVKFAPRVVSSDVAKFDEIVKKVIGLGFDPTKLKFVYAVAVICQQQESTWEHKIKVYKSLGWSDDEIISAFKTAPLSMAYSEEKLRRAVGFFVNKMNLQPSLLAKNPMMMGHSLEERIKPRCSVLRVLMSKGVLKEEHFTYGYVLRIGEKQFMNRFVIKYCKDVPELLSAFKGKPDSHASGSSHKLAQ